MGFSTFPAASAASKWERTVHINSTQAWVAPNDVTQVELILCGGGGGGGSGQNAATGGTGGGGSADFTVLTVTAGQSYTVTIGGGGTGGVYPNTNGASGGTSSFGALLSTPGGIGAGFGQRSSLGSGKHGGSGGMGPSSTVGYTWMLPGLGFSGYGHGGGGGGTMSIHGGAGQVDQMGTLTNAKANSGSGGAGGLSSGNGTTGGSGIAVIKYWSAL
jgi:hypothetical protein